MNDIIAALIFVIFIIIIITHCGDSEASKCFKFVVYRYIQQPLWRLDRGAGTERKVWEGYSLAKGSVGLVQNIFLILVVNCAM